MNKKTDVFFGGRLCKVYKKKRDIFCCHKAHDEMGTLSRRKLLLGAPRFYRAKSKSIVRKYESFNLLETSGPVLELF
jgi:hypothetical protein